jgi:hypothetical protein
MLTGRQVTSQREGETNVNNRTDNGLGTSIRGGLTANHSAIVVRGGLTANHSAIVVRGR